MNENEYKSKLKERLNFYKFPKKEIDSFSDELLTNYKNCAYCSIKLDEHNYSVEHIENPTSSADFANKASTDNIVLCCRSCNRSKKNKNLECWFSSNTWYLSDKNKVKDGKSVIAHIKEHTPNSKNPKIKKAAKKVFS